MASGSWLFGTTETPRPSYRDVIREHRERVALEAAEAAERRRRQIAEQSSDLNSPEIRIRTWEKVHGVRLPRSATHPVLAVAAADTHLTLEQIRAEQRRRSSPEDGNQGVEQQP